MNICAGSQLQVQGATICHCTSLCLSIPLSLSLLCTLTIAVHVSRYQHPILGGKPTRRKQRQEEQSHRLGNGLVIKCRKQGKPCALHRKVIEALTIVQPSRSFSITVAGLSPIMCCVLKEGKVYLTQVSTIAIESAVTLFSSKNLRLLHNPSISSSSNSLMIKSGIIGPHGQSSSYP